MYRFSSFVAVLLLTLGCQGTPPETLEDVPTQQSAHALTPKEQTALEVCRTPGMTPRDGEPRASSLRDGTIEKKREWPCNGFLVNMYSSPVQIWSDYVYGSVAAYSTSHRFDDDVDFVLEPCSGQWLKIGPLNATVWPWGCVTGYLWAENPPK